MSTFATSAPLAARHRRRSRPTFGWWVVVVLASLIVVYALGYVVVGPPMYPGNLAASFLARPWGIYPHALFGALALGLGPVQFHRGVLTRHRTLHRRLGTVYVASSVLVGLAGLYMSVYSFGGWSTHLGFGALAIFLLFATLRAYVAARRRTIATHRQWMLRSYALIFAAVTLRIELPLLVAAFGAFLPAYQVVAWLSWVPNALWAEWYVRRTIDTPLPTFTSIASSGPVTFAPDPRP
jgi:uncharacterized membrane protein